jgi:quinol monooxygenase YgiN
MIAFYTRFTTAPETRSQLAAILLNAAEGIASNTDCRRYDVALDARDPGVIAVYELWTGEDAHREALQDESAKSLIAQALPLLTARPEQVRSVVADA